uniref:Atrial natriuretic peptide n=1 Tax=Anguilla japonica TaxID=7937 RepID=Q9PSV1_ANGJA|nr:atrial natriuretic peptide [Anguilla japonica]
MRKIILTGLLLVLLCQQAMVAAHVLSRPYSANDLARLKSFLEQFEDTLAREEVADNPGDYEDAKPEEAERGQPGPEWDRERGGQGPASDLRGPGDGYQAQRSWLQDLLMSTRSKSSSPCFGGKLDRIGSYSGLGCNSRKG